MEATTAWKARGWSRKRIRLVLLAFLAGLTLFRLYYAGSIPLSEDEANYWQWARHLDFGYYDQGPLIAWIIALGAGLLGHNELGVRFPAVLMFLGLSLLIYDFCRQIFKNEALGLALVVAASGMILFSTGAIIHTYDTPQAFFWMLCLYFTGLALYTDRSWAWYGGGAAAGLAMLAKYSSVLLPVLVIVFLIVSPRHRPWLMRREPWLGAAAAVVIFSPNLVWNATHYWTAFGHTQGLAGGAWKFTTFEFLAGQMALIGPVAFVLLIIGLVLAWGRVRRGDDLQAFLLLTSLPVLFLFLLLSAKTRIFANWPGPGYLGGMLAAGRALWPRMIGSSRWRNWGAAAVITGYILTALTLFHGPVLKALKVPGESDPTVTLYGGPEVGREIGRLLDKWPGEKPFLFGLRYQKASWIAFYTPGQPRTEGLFLPVYRLNCYVFWTDPRRLQGRDGLGVIDLKSLEDPGPDFKWLFESCDRIKIFPIRGPAGT
ncbi:MAG: glycosyltransferase family 39 protein, partial [Pseudomonadota bacterium]